MEAFATVKQARFFIGDSLEARTQISKADAALDSDGCLGLSQSTRDTAIIFNWVSVQMCDHSTACNTHRHIRLRQSTIQRGHRVTPDLVEQGSSTLGQRPLAQLLWGSPYHSGNVIFLVLLHKVCLSYNLCAHYLFNCPYIILYRQCMKLSRKSGQVNCHQLLATITS